MKSPLSNLMRLAGKGFTLVELLVAITILSIILFSLAQAMGFVSQLWISGAGALDNFGKARDIMTVMDRDIQQMVLRPDLPAFVDNASPPLQTCAFYTNVEGAQSTTPPDGRAVSLVQYVPENDTQYTLTRKNYGSTFTPGQTPTIASTNLSDLPKTAASSEIVATGVVEFGYQFVDATGTIQTPTTTYQTNSGYAIAAAPAGTPYTYSYNFTAPTASTNVRAVIVSLLVLSNTGYQLVQQSPTLMTKLVADFAGNLPVNETYSQYWNGILNPTTGTFDHTLPVPVRSGLRVYQRYIPLPVITPAS